MHKVYKRAVPQNFYICPICHNDLIMWSEKESLGIVQMHLDNLFAHCWFHNVIGRFRYINSGSVPWCSTSVGSIVNLLCHYPVLSMWCQDLFYHEPLFHQCYTCTICQMVTLQLVNLATKIMIIFHLTIYVIHYLCFFVFYG